MTPPDGAAGDTPAIRPVTGRLRRAWGELVGPEATPASTAATLALAAAGGIAAARVRGLDPARRTVLVVMAVDLWGGAWANNTRACARWYERPGQTDADHVRFAASHLHPLVLAWVDRRGADGLARAALHHGFLVAATVAVRRTWGRRRTVGPALAAAGCALDLAFGPSRSAPWFAPVFHAKLLVGHASAALWSDAQLRGVS